MNEPLITNDAVTLGILMAILGFVFWTSSSGIPFWKKFYTFVPSLFVCYFLPSILGTFGLASASGPHESDSVSRVTASRLCNASLLARELTPGRL